MGLQYAIVNTRLTVVFGSQAIDFPRLTRAPFEALKSTAWCGAP
jgi:hypothetical protein